MAKSKEPKAGSKIKSEVKPLSAVKNASITKPSQTPSAKSKQVAKAVAIKATNGKSVKKAPPPPSDCESDSDSGSDSASDSNSDSESEVKKVDTPTNGKGQASKKEVDSSDSSDSTESSGSESDSESDSDAPAPKQQAASDSDDSDDSASESGSDSDDEVTPATVAKNAVKDTVDTGKNAANGAAKAVTKADVGFIALYYMNTC